MAPRRKYAEKTPVPVGRSQDEIRKLVLDRGATGWMLGEDGTRAMVQFRMQNRMLRFRIEVPSDDAAEERRLWRALFMAIKAKLVIAEEGIETFDEVFLANIVMPDGSTVADSILEDVQTSIESGRQAPLMLGAGSKR